MGCRYLAIASGTMSKTSSDLAKIEAAFDVLQEAGWAATADGVGLSVSDGWSEIGVYAEDLIDSGARQGQFPTAFWTRPANGVFDQEGNLRTELCLLWRGDADVLRDALTGAGVTVRTENDGDSVLLYLQPSAEPVPPNPDQLVPASELVGGDTIRFLIEADPDEGDPSRIEGGEIAGHQHGRWRRADRSRSGRRGLHESHLRAKRPRGEDRPGRPTLLRRLSEPSKKIAAQLKILEVESPDTKPGDVYQEVLESVL